MKKSIKYQLSKALGQNVDLNKKAIQIKRSWDEVAAMLGKNKSKPKD
ncbi:hypothetical protein QA584_28410 [Anaerocolumna sp. AGMB13025]|nr:hypothetical protein [Anaerocolumna sp. AGMB13025]WFR57481.1 hypothetical protein QA584_28410 [Anaerocolumna sp. AGMB13025]